MPRTYKMQGKIEKLSVKTSNSSYRLSDQKQILYAGSRTDHELQYLRNQNTDSATVNTHLSDAWVKFGEANGGGSSGRSDQIQHDFDTSGSYP